MRAPRRVRAALGPLCEQQRLSRPSGDDGPSAVSCVALDEGGGCAVTGAEDGALALWVRDEGGGGWRLGAVTNAHDDEVESVAVRGALVLSGGGDGKVHAWRLDAEGELLWKLRTLLSVKGDGEVGVLSLAMPPADGGGGEARADCAWAVCGAQDGRIRVVATAGGTETQALRVRGRRPGAAWVYSLALGDGGGGASLLLGGTFEGLCALWRAPPAVDAPPTFVLERELRPFSDDPNTDGVLSVALNAVRGWAAAGTNDGVVRVGRRSTRSRCMGRRWRRASCAGDPVAPRGRRWHARVRQGALRAQVGERRGHRRVLVLERELALLGVALGDGDDDLAVDLAVGPVMMSPVFLSGISARRSPSW